MLSDSYFKHFRDILTAEQIRAITCPNSPTIVQAGAGSGKTSVIAHRFIYLVREYKIDPERILLVTFTNQAVRNMDKKIRLYVTDCLEISDEDVNAIYNNVNVMTFHALCKRILEWVYDSKDKSSTTRFIYDAQFLPIVKEVLKEYPHIKAAYRVKDILLRLRRICKGQNREFTEDDLVEIAMNVDIVYEREKILQKYPLKDIREIYVKFDQTMKKRSLGTLDDILLEANKYLMSDSSIVTEWSSRYDAILCDEFQDVDDFQFNVLTKLSSIHNNLFCVGDPAQAIYGFRGSIPQAFPKLEKYFYNKEIFIQKCSLTKNFRSTPQIIDVANAVIRSSKMEENLKKELKANRTVEGETPTVQILTSEQDQAVAIVQKIEELKNKGVRLSDMAILARKRSNYNRIKNMLLCQSIHYEDYKETFPLLQNKVIRDLVGWISIAFISDDDKQWVSHLKRIYNTPPSGIGAATFQRILDRIQESGGSAMDVIGEWNFRGGKGMLFARKIKKIKLIANDTSISLKERYWKIAKEGGIWNYYLKKYGENSHRMDTIQKFLDSSIVANAQSWDGALMHVEKYLNMTNQDRIICSTIHGVKGLEFKHVFLISVSEGHIPTSRGLRLCKNEQKREAYIEDERRVFYVAITRAKDNLYLFSDKEETSIFLDDVKSFLKSDVPIVSISNLQRRLAIDREMANEELNMDDDEYMESVLEDGSPTDVL